MNGLDLCFRFRLMVFVCFSPLAWLVIRIRITCFHTKIVRIVVLLPESSNLREPTKTNQNQQPHHCRRLFVLLFFWH